MRTLKNWSRMSLGHPKFGTGCPLEIWLGCQIYGLRPTLQLPLDSGNIEPVIKSASHADRTCKNNVAHVLN
jgi:hypothetical protein